MGVSGLTTFLRDNRQSTATYESIRASLPTGGGGDGLSKKGRRRRRLESGEGGGDGEGEVANPGWEGDGVAAEEKEIAGEELKDEVEKCTMVVDAWG